MAYPLHCLVAMGGHFTVPGGTEVWESTIRVTPTGSPGHMPDPGSYMLEIAAAIGSWFQHADTAAATTTFLDYLKVNNIDADGHYHDGFTNIFNYPQPTAGTGVEKLSIIECVAMSWGTEVTRGKAARGRMYFPNRAVVPDTPGLITVSAAGAHFVWVRAWALLEILRNVAGTQQAVPVVVSRSAGIMRIIESVRVGRVVDVQRRRKNAVPELYVDA